MRCGDHWDSPIINRGYIGSAERPWRHPECRGTTPPTQKKTTLNIELKDLSGATNDVIGTTGDIKTALKSIGDPPMDTTWISQATNDLAGVREAMTRMRDELANNLAKLSTTGNPKSKSTWPGTVEN